MTKYLAIQTNGDGRPCGWGIAANRQDARAEAERQWRRHGHGSRCYPGEERGEVFVHELAKPTGDPVIPALPGIVAECKRVLDAAHKDLGPDLGWSALDLCADQTPYSLDSIRAALRELGLK